jgi:hypothetical protein
VGRVMGIDEVDAVVTGMEGVQPEIEKVDV